MKHPHPTSATIGALAVFTLNAFISRRALHGSGIDAMTFSAIRLCAAAAALTVFWKLRDGLRLPRPTCRSLLSGALLACYLICFSFAFARAELGISALSMFGTMQATMIIGGLRRGEGITLPAAAGHTLSAAGFVCFIGPGAAASRLFAIGLMAIAGCTWGLYSLLSSNRHDPLAATATNLLYAAPIAAMVIPFVRADICVSGEGAILAILSGILGSGIGCVLWYRAASRLSAGAAAACQLMVPLLVALVDTLLSSAALDLHIVWSGAIIAAGMKLVLAPPERRVSSASGLPVIGGART